MPTCTRQKPRRLPRILLWLALGLWAAPFAPAARVALDPALTQLCYDAIARNSQRTGVPHDVMLAISLTETGRKLAGRIRPWPWTVNMEGKGFWFATREEALAYVRKRFDEGARSFDVGCFQINYKWHHQHFRSIEDMFDPQINAAYAAKFLGDLYMEKGNWTAAAGAYHSRTPQYANKYSQRFARFRARLTGKDVVLPEGHGSEPLRVAAHTPDPPPAPPQPRRPRMPALDLARQEPLVSDTESPLGSLAATPSGSPSGGLLRSTSGALF